MSITRSIKGILQRRRYLLNRRVGAERVGEAAFYGWLLRGRAIVMMDDFLYGEPQPIHVTP